MNVLTKLAAFVQGAGLETLPAARFDRLKLHIVDACVARLAGSRTDEGAAIARLCASMPGLDGDVLAACAQTRCTEVDDIHLASCTTPGSVVVSTALALAAPERLYEVRRTPPFLDDGIRELISKIRVRRARDLDRHYPRAWPARVEIRTGGRRYSRLVLRPHGDARHPFGWDDMGRKCLALARAIDNENVARVVAEMRRAAATTEMPALWTWR